MRWCDKLRKKIRCREQGDCHCKMAGTGFPSVMANRPQMCTADCHEENNRTADFHRQESKFESGLTSGSSCCGKPRYT
jgi:hypothetical protein